MNIKSMIKPLLFGREGIDDNAWNIKITVTNYRSDPKLRIKCQNTYTNKTKRGIEKISEFNLILFVEENGDFKFNRITLCVSGSTNTDHRFITKHSLYELFRNSIEEKLLSII